MKVTVAKSHVSSYPNPISFELGDTLELGERDEEYAEWIKVRMLDGNTGWAPVQYIECNESESRGIALKDYSAFELTTKIGQELDVVLELNSWYLAKTPNGKVGWVPCHTVKIVTSFNPAQAFQIR